MFGLNWFRRSKSEAAWAMAHTLAVTFLAYILPNYGFARPTIWAMPPSANGGQAIRDLFAYPDEWTHARAIIDVLGFRDHSMMADFTDAELRSWLMQMKRWGLKLGLEVGAIKTWGPSAEKSFKIGYRLWQRIEQDGGEISAFAMDEPLRSSEFELKKDVGYATAETSRFVILIRQAFPKAEVGDIEPYPGFSKTKILGFVDDLQAKLRAAKTRGLDFLRLDVDWMRFRGDSLRAWEEVHELQKQLQQRGLKFDLIIWAANYPALNQQKLATSNTWENSILSEGKAYRDSGPEPDDYVVESWLDTPLRSTPENGRGTFMRSINDFLSIVSKGE